MKLKDSLNNDNKKVVDRIGKRKYKAQKLNALSFFSGAMGLDLGLEKAGVNILLACEIDNSSRKTIIHNDKEVGLIGDLLAYSISEILKYANVECADKIDLIVGGPPCQAFSTAGRRMGFQDTRGNVFLKYIDIIINIKPKYFVIENVRGLLSTPMTIQIKDEVTELFDFNPKDISGSSLYYIKKKLQKAGYTISFNLYNSANYGVPQIRERVVMIGTLEERKVPYLLPTHSDGGNYGLAKWVTFKDAVKNLDSNACEHINFSEKRLKYINLLKEGQNWRDLPIEIQPEAMGNSYYLGGGKTGFYRRLSWSRPAPTLVTHPAMPATELAHPELPRPLSVQEYKRIQQFPDSWEIQGNIVDKYKQIGNAVPLGLGYAIGSMLISHSKGKEKSPPLDFQYSRYKSTSDVEWENQFQKQVKTIKSKFISRNLLIDI
jgi:DNA (cytosine-5)-methyltransferase 1